ncbi:MAG: TonB-dependent receptor plug domain-containing protein, partial [Ekhidna sp.]|nr:TonB-dependent receptor plug domain-containing protein [Ekhidna sp.]
TLLNEVIVEGNQVKQIFGKGQVGVMKIDIDKLEKLPSFLGTLDVVKSATALPGVTVSGESSSYLNVRGGGNDQTLVLMNNTSIYNPGHLLGFFSVFNGDFVSDMTLYKGNIPARYGNRASSVLDVKMNNWGEDKVNVSGGIGIANSNLGVKSKHFDDRLDLHVGGRISYVGWLLNSVPDEEILRSTARFGDANLSSRFKLNENNTLFLTSYYGGDFFRYADDIIYRWSTFNNGLKWSHLFNNDWVLESEISSSRLSNSSEGLTLNDEFRFENGISELSLKSTVSNDFLEAGIDFSSFGIEIGEIRPNSPNSLTSEQEMDEERLITLGVHGSYVFSISENTKINPGLRLNFYGNYGPQTVNLYGSSGQLTSQNKVGEEKVESGSAVSTTFALEPRLGISQRWNNTIVRLGYSRINQFLHLISNTMLVNPATVWKGSDRYIPPTVIDQYSIGVEHEIKKTGMTIGVEGFYKTLNNQIEYRDAARLLLNENLEQDILRGQGTVHGIEFLLSRNQGKVTGLVSYTYSRAFVRVSDPIQGIEINGGERYPYYSDRPHNIKSNIDVKLTKKWTISSNFTYISGSPISLPVATYQIDGVDVPLFSERNSERIPDYHRLDLVFTLKSRIRKTKKNNDRWVLTLYNVYSRENIANVFFSSQEDAPAQPFQLVNIGTIVPTLTYKFEF